MRLNDFFDKIFVINLDRRTDRWAECLAEMEKFGIEAERFSGSVVHLDGKLNGNAGCTLSHRRLLKTIAEGPWEKVLVLEDDFLPYIRPANRSDYRDGFKVTREQLEEAFGVAVAHLPENWDMFYLAGHYSSKPLSRMNAHMIRMDKMHTTSSYGTTKQFAKVLSDQLESEAVAIDSLTPERAYLGPVDSVFSNHLPHHNCYICQPRLFIQRPSYSDLTEREENYSFCMMDTRHEEMV